MDAPKDSETTFGIAAMGEVPNNEDFDITTATAMILIATINFTNFISLLYILLNEKSILNFEFIKF
ncbi:hypothetical protein SUT007_10710 [Streptococcus parasuis]|nr:hypothetical protein SUT007_10710 [Streptococcus parasuis]